MSTARRRPTGGSRRPQVAGRPRTAAGNTDAATASTAANAPDAGAGANDGADGGRVAVEERAGAGDEGQERAEAREENRPRTFAGLRSRVTGRDGAAAGAGDPDGGDPGDGGGADGGETAGDTDGGAGAALPAAPAVRSGEGDGEPGGDGGRSGAASRWAGALRGVPLAGAPTSRRATAALLAVTILLVAAAAFFAVSWARLQFSGSTSNTALTDVGATAAISEQVGDAVTKVYSFDFARLDQAEADARAVITGPFTTQFDQIFGNVRQLAPQQQAVVTATIPKSAVASIDGDRASVYVFVNQVVRRVDDAGAPQQGTAAARLRVDAQYVDGRWKLAGMTPA